MSSLTILSILCVHCYCDVIVLGVSVGIPKNTNWVLKRREVDSHSACYPIAREERVELKLEIME